MQQEYQKLFNQLYIKNKISSYQTKKDNQENQKYQDIYLPINKIGISLGNACYSAIWAVVNGYRKKKQDGYKTCVFDLMISNYNGIVKCILEDFNNFTDPAYLICENQCIINTYYNFCFNHEGPGHADLYIKENWPEGIMHFVNNNYANFIERYNTRIYNFKNYLSDPNNYICFIFQFVNDQYLINNFQDLRDALRLKYPHLKYEIIVV